MAVFLSGVGGALAGSRWRLAPGALTIGSADDCDVRLPAGDGVRAIHATLQISPREITIATSRGAAVTVDGKPVAEPMRLQPGQVIRIGAAQLRLETAAEPVAPVPPPSPSPSAEATLALPPPPPPKWPLVVGMLVLALLVVGLVAVWKFVPQQVKVVDNRFSDDVLTTIRRATVLILTDLPRGMASGSGFVLRDGVVVTNAHVVQNGVKIRVIFDSGTPQTRRVEAKVARIGDPETQGDDVAVLKCETGKQSHLPLLDLATLRLGTPVAAFGYPLGDQLSTSGNGPEVSVRAGTVTALRRDSTGQIIWVESDVAAEMGNSGGPLVTTDGKVAGLATAILGAHLKITNSVTAERIARYASGI